MNMFVVVFEVNQIKNLKQWSVDTNATRHIYTKKKMFSTHKEMDGEHLYMKNSTSKVLDIGKDLLKMTYKKKKLALNYVLHVAHIRMNLMFGLLLSKNGSKLIFKSDKCILFKNKACI